MRVLLSTIGSRGDVQPLVALASELRTLGPDVRLCVPPDFREWIENLGMPVVSIGPEVSGFARRSAAALPTPEQGRKMIADTVATQFATIAAAAEGCDVIGLLNSHRASIGLSPVDDVRSHILTNRPWLAADPPLAPWPDDTDEHVFQPGAWILPDARPLSPELEVFLAAGEPPVYFGFGSNRAPQNLSRIMIETARALGRRAIVSRGWADLSLVDSEPDCLSIGEVNQQVLFRRVAAVVRHGGAGTATAAARSGAAQVIVPQAYDQHYWSQRVEQLGIGSAHALGARTTTSLTSALERTLRPDVAARARSTAAAMGSDGAHLAARRLLTRPMGSL